MSFLDLAQACFWAAIWGLVTALAFRYGTIRFRYKDLPKPTTLKIAILAVFLAAYFLAISFNHFILAIFAFPIYFISFYWIMKKLSE